MALVRIIEYAEASAEVRVVYDDIMKTRGVDWVNNFWKALANDPALLARTWAQVKQVMASGALDPLAKEMIYVAVSATNGCEYCTYSTPPPRARRACRTRCSWSSWRWSALPTRPTASRTACACRSTASSFPGSTFLPSGVTR